MRTRLRLIRLCAPPLLAVMLLGVLSVDPFESLTPTVQAQARNGSGRDRIDADIVWRIRREATDKSQIMPTIQALADLYGPRLTGSPNLRRAQDWILEQVTSWGLKNAHLEEWDFGHPGWSSERASVYLVSPVTDTLVVEVLAWTPSTPGTVTASPIVLNAGPPQRPTQAEMDKWFEPWKGTLKGKAVMIGAPSKVDVAFEVPAKRRDDGEMRTRFGVDDPPPAGGGQAAAASSATSSTSSAPVRLTNDQVAEQLSVFLVNEGATLRVIDAGRTHGQIRAFNNRTFDITKAVPTIVMRNEDYGRIARLQTSGQSVSIEATIVNRTHPEGRTQHNVIAEIPGSDKASEVVMLGGHLDSWHAATGATDNAVGVAVMMEVVRILQAIDAKPRRTVRLALWSGEEQGLRGSTAYVAAHFGSHENPKPEYDRFGGYFNLDSGTGRARGLTIFGPPAAARALRPILRPFQDNGVMGATTTRSRNRGGSDHTSFNEAGLPGISVFQDPIEYNSHSWHTNLDTYERIIESDTQQAAMAIAASVYHVATRDELLPRFPKDEMPRKPGSTAQTTAP